MNFKSFALLLGLTLVTPTFANADDALLRRVDVFHTILDQSGSMYMGGMCVKGQNKMVTAKQALRNVLDAVPSGLEYKSDLALSSGNKELYDGKYDKEAYLSKLDAVRDTNTIFGRLTPLWSAIDNEVVEPHTGKKEALILVTDGDWNRGKNPVETVKELYEKNPNVTVHVISLADTENGRKTIEEIAALKKGSVVADVCSLLSKEGAADFANKVFFGYGKTVEVYFDFDKSTLREETVATLDSLKETDLLTTGVDIKGYTCNIGSNKYNKKLSKRRADAVANYLDVKDATVEGMGKSFKYDNKVPAEREKNRRVDITVR